MARKTPYHDEYITLSHGSGGALMQDLIHDVFFRYLDSAPLAQFDDAAELSLDNTRLAFTTDTFVVKPVFFPGGDIGSLSVSGTVNDLLMKGAQPLWLSLGFVIEEGFAMHDLVCILESIQKTCEHAGVSVVTGDTKVVGRGELDGICINTSGIGSIPEGIQISGSNAKAGDSVIVSGPIGDHGIAVMAERNHLSLKGAIESDAAPLTDSVIPLLERFGASIHVLRDPTRGGIAATLNEIAESSSVGIILEESEVPIRGEVQAVCDLLGFDPLYVPCEGRFQAFVDEAATADVLSFLQGIESCSGAAKIGRVVNSPSGEVLLASVSGGQRIVDMPAGELLPRIC